MSQINVNKVISPDQAANNGPSLDIAANGNITVDTNTLFVDSTNNRFGVGTSSPIRTLDLSADGGAALLAGLLRENCNITGVAIPANANHDVNSGSVHVWNAATSSFTYNIRYSASESLNNNMAVGQTVFAVAIVPITTSTHYVTEVRVDGVAQTVEWTEAETPIQAGSVDEAATAGYDLYTFQVIKTADAAYTVFGGQNHFGSFT